MEMPKRQAIEDSHKIQIKSSRNYEGKMQNPDSFERCLISKMGGVWKIID